MRYCIERKGLGGCSKEDGWDRQKMIDKSTGEVLGPKVDYSCYNEKF